MLAYVPVVQQVPPPPMIQNCKYQVRQDVDTYVCYNEEEYKVYLQQAEAKREKSWQEFKRFWYIWLPITAIVVIGIITS